MNALDVLATLRLEDGRRWWDAAHPFQLEDARAVLEGERPYHFLTRARGASKTTDLAAVALGLLLSTDDARRLYWLASDADQGALAIDSIAGFVARTLALAGRVEVQTRRVRVPGSGAALDVLPADAAGAWGLRPWAVFADELSQWSDTLAPRRLWEAVSSAVAKQADARLVVLTTAGDPGHFSRKVLDHAQASPLWRVHEVPGPAPWMDADRLAEQRARLPESSFARLFENRWIEGEDRLTDAGALADCVTHEGPLDHDSRHGYAVALDLGLKRDRTAAVVCHREGEKVTLDRIAVWQGSRLRPVRLADVEEWVEQAARSFGRARVVLDPWQTVGLAQRLRDRGLKVEEFAFTQQSVGRLAATLFNLLRDRALALPDDPELLEELANVRLRETSPGVFRLDHDSGRHDDRAVALALAATHLLREPDHGPIQLGPSVWGSPISDAGAERINRRARASATDEPAPPPRHAVASPAPPRREGRFLIHDRVPDTRRSWPG